MTNARRMLAVIVVLLGLSSCVSPAMRGYGSKVLPSGVLRGGFCAEVQQSSFAVNDEAIEGGNENPKQDAEFHVKGRFTYPELFLRYGLPLDAEVVVKTMVFHWDLNLRKEWVSALGLTSSVEVGAGTLSDNFTNDTHYFKYGMSVGYELAHSEVYCSITQAKQTTKHGDTGQSFRADPVTVNLGCEFHVEDVSEDKAKAHSLEAFYTFDRSGNMRGNAFGLGLSLSY